MFKTDLGYEYVNMDGKTIIEWMIVQIVGQREEMKVEQFILIQLLSLVE